MISCFVVHILLIIEFHDETLSMSLVIFWWTPALQRNDSLNDYIVNILFDIPVSNGYFSK